MNYLNNKERTVFPTARDTLELTQATQTTVNDLNQPLTTLMSMFARFKLIEDVSPAGRELIASMEQEIGRMGKITRKLSRLTEDTTRRRILKPQI
ncbi:MAG: hypothetical protein JXX14_23855 [Deltaproteobacteria bacterium]|nr:hypothetical protein [Deltaproteobacteria bacterium]